MVDLSYWTRRRARLYDRFTCSIRLSALFHLQVSTYPVLFVRTCPLTEHAFGFGIKIETKHVPSLTLSSVMRSSTIEHGLVSCRSNSVVDLALANVVESLRLVDGGAGIDVTGLRPINDNLARLMDLAELAHHVFTEKIDYS